VKLTAAGEAAAAALRKRPTSENPRLSCQPTSILFDWVFDGAIGRIMQSANAIKMEYGVGLTRTILMNMTAHPANIKPSRAGHSIGRWDGDTLVVDTVGFLPGTLAGNLPHSDKLHVVERFTLMTPDVIRYEATIDDPKTFTRPWKISFPLYRRMEPNVQLMEFKCQPFVEELLYGRFTKK
jgi:hypothetical protein